MAEVPPPHEEILLTHFIVSDDVERSRRFYTEVLGGRVAFSSPGGPTNVALSNSWIVINAGGGPTDDKPEVTLETPADPNRVSSFVNIRVKDVETVYSEWSARGAQFLTRPKQHQYEIRCYIRDPDGHLIEVGQTTDPQGDWVPEHWPAATPAGELPPPPEGIVLAHSSCRTMSSALAASTPMCSGEGRRSPVPEGSRMSKCRTVGSSSTSAEGRPTTSRRSPWKRLAIPTGSAVSSISE